MTGPANQQIVIDDEILQRQVRTLRDAAEVLKTAATQTSRGVGAHAFGAMCGPLLGAPISALAQTSTSALTAAAALAAAASAGVASTAGAFTEVEEDAVATFDRIEDGL